MKATSLKTVPLLILELYTYLFDGTVPSVISSGPHPKQHQDMDHLLVMCRHFSLWTHFLLTYMMVMIFLIILISLLRGHHLLLLHLIFLYLPVTPTKGPIEHICFDAYHIFGETTNTREMCINFPNHPHILSGWIVMTARSLGVLKEGKIVI